MATSDSPNIGIYTQQVGPGRAATMVFDDGGTLDLTSGKVTFPGALARGYIDLGPHLFAARQAASGEKITSGSTAPSAFFGGIIGGADATPSLDMVTTGNHIVRFQWASAIVTAIALPPIAMPADMSTAGNLNLELYGETVGTASAADAAQGFTVEARMSVLSSASSTNIGATAPDFTSTPGWSVLTLATGSITTAFLDVILTPQAHAARALNLYAARVSYAKKTS